MQLKPGEHFHGGSVTHTHSSQATQPSNYIGNLFAVDLSIQKTLPRLKGRVDIKTQANYTNSGENNYIKLSSSGKTEVSYSFENTTKLGFAMLTYKPVLVENNIIKNTGVFVRGGIMELPIGSLWYENTKEISFGFNYSFRWNNLLKLGYQQILSAKKGYTNNIMIQWAMGF